MRLTATRHVRLRRRMTHPLRFAHLLVRALPPAALLAFAPVRAEAQTVGEAFVNLFRSAKLYVDPSSHASQQANAWRRSRPADAALMDKIASKPLAKWVGNWNVNIGRDVAEAVGRITGAQALPVFVALQHSSPRLRQLLGGRSRERSCISAMDSRIRRWSWKQEIGSDTRAGRAGGTGLPRRAGAG